MLDIWEVAALRLYTTSLFRMINVPLRQKILSRSTNERAPLPVTTYYITTGLKKLRANNIQPGKFEPKFLWRGMKDRTLPSDFLIRGGTEAACMSTSDDLFTIAGYARSMRPLCEPARGTEPPRDPNPPIRPADNARPLPSGFRSLC
jgi:hypothetical protein